MQILRRAAFAGAVAAAVFAAPLRAQSGFEGVIEFKGLGRDSTVLTQTSKGPMVRIDGERGGKADGPQFTVILDTKARTMTMLMVAEQKYMVRPMPSFDSILSGDKRKGSFTNTGRTATVAGVTCEIYHATTTAADGKVTEGEACMAKGVGFAMFQAFGGGRRGPQGSPAEIFHELAAKDLHVLKVWTMKDGQMVPEMEAVKIEKKSIPNSEFEVPAGFTKFEMPTGMGAPPKP